MAPLGFSRVPEVNRITAGSSSPRSTGDGCLRLDLRRRSSSSSAKSSTDGLEASDERMVLQGRARSTWSGTAIAPALSKDAEPGRNEGRTVRKPDCHPVAEALPNAAHMRRSADTTATRRSSSPVRVAQWPGVQQDQPSRSPHARRRAPVRIRRQVHRVSGALPESCLTIMEGRSGFDPDEGRFGMGVLEGKAAIVTGSARGIGRATAELLFGARGARAH